MTFNTFPGFNERIGSILFLMFISVLSPFRYILHPIGSRSIGKLRQRDVKPNATIIR